MAASKNNAAPAIVAVPEEDIAEIIAAQAGTLEQLDGGTVRETNTVYEDRTINPHVDRVVEYESETVELDGGTVMVTYGDPVGGFPEAE